MRPLPHKEQEDLLRETLRAGGDPHTAVAARMFEIPQEQVNREQRNVAKACNYHLLYSSEFMSSVWLWPEKR